jgi:hypothetical protein
VPPTLTQEYLRQDDQLEYPPPRIHRWVRVVLVLMAVGLIAVFTVAVWLNPYEANGSARKLETHLQLGLPECTFKQLTGKPCPSCGMTTSFALFVRGDLANAMRANSVGLLLAVFCFFLVPYSLICSLRGRYLGLLSMEWLLPRFVVIFCVLMLLRWAVVLWLG